MIKIEKVNTNAQNQARAKINLNPLLVSNLSQNQVNIFIFGVNLVQFEATAYKFDDLIVNMNLSTFVSAGHCHLNGCSVPFTGFYNILGASLPKIFR